MCEDYNGQPSSCPVSAIILGVPLEKVPNYIYIWGVDMI